LFLPPRRSPGKISVGGGDRDEGDFPFSAGGVKILERICFQGGNMKYLKLLFFVFSLHFMSISVFADTIYLIDGRSYKGEFIKGDKNAIVFQSGEKTMGFRKKTVLSIFFGEREMPWGEKAGVKATAEKEVKKEVIKDEVKSEILRGDAAIFEVTLKAGVDLNKGSEGISSVIQENQQKNTDTEPFYLGAYFKAWNFFASMIKVLKQGGNPEFSEAIALGESNANNYFKEFRKRQKEMGIDDKTLMAITEVEFEIVKPAIEEWEMRVKDLDHEEKDDHKPPA
jgi:hypothetical protein